MMDVQFETNSDVGYIPDAETFAWVKQVHTLGPTGTNCERAALSWALRRCQNASVKLHRTMEQAADSVACQDGAVLVGVVAYPHLHSIIYAHIQKMKLLDVFIMNTDNMVLASRTGAEPLTCATHPAPEKLLPTKVERRFVSSNVVAARDCAEGHADGCITTLCAAEKFGLPILRKFGPVPMGFTIHGPLEKRACQDCTQHA